MNIKMTNKKKKEIEHNRKRYIRVRLGDKSKKKNRKKATCCTLCITRTDICVMKSSLQRGKRKTRIFLFWTIMKQKEREREEILTCSFVMIFYVLSISCRRNPIAEVHAHPNLYLQHTTTYHLYSLRSFYMYIGHEFSQVRALTAIMTSSFLPNLTASYCAIRSNRGLLV